MSCEEWRERILEADPAELRGERETPLAAHLTGCGVCSAAARRILAGESALGDALDTLVGAEVAIVRRVRRRRRLAPWMVPAALAAGLAGIWLATGGPKHDGSAPAQSAATPMAAAGSAAAPGPAAQAPGSARGLAVSSRRDYVVFETGDPNIAVVWFLSPRRGS